MMTKLDAEKLLPYYLNGTLTAVEADDVELALADYPELQEELDFLQALRKHMQSQASSANSPGELGLKRLQQQLAKPQPVRASRPARGWRAIAIAASFLLLVQTTIVFQAGQPADYFPAGGAVDSESGGTVISLTFAPVATERQIRAILLASNSRIIDGPSALGVYQIVVVDEVEDSIEWLEAQGIIETLQVH